MTVNRDPYTTRQLGHTGRKFIRPRIKVRGVVRASSPPRFSSASLHILGLPLVTAFCYLLTLSLTLSPFALTNSSATDVGQHISDPLRLPVYDTFPVASAHAFSPNVFYLARSSLPLPISTHVPSQRGCYRFRFTSMVAFLRASFHTAKGRRDAWPTSRRAYGVLL